jgi:tetratricopeptide (TPR) repeat protein
VLEGYPQAAITRLHSLSTGDLTWDYAVTLLSALAAAHLELGDLERARTNAGHAVAEAHRLGVRVQETRALHVQGMIQARCGNHDLARAAYNEGLQRARSIPFSYGEAQILHAYGLLDRQQGNEAAAQAKFADALAIVESLGAGKDADRLREAMTATGKGKPRPGADSAGLPGIEVNNNGTASGGNLPGLE